MGLRVITAPTDEPITLEEAKAHLRVTHSSEDDYILALVTAARSMIENETHRALMSQTLEYTLDYFEPPLIYGQAIALRRPTVIELPRPPLRSVSLVTYLDGSGATATLHDTTGSPQVDDALVLVNVLDDRLPGGIAPVANGPWPATYDQLGAVAIRYVAGYGADGAGVPMPLIQAMKLAIGHWFEHRESVSETPSIAELPMGVQFLLNPYRVLSIV